MNVWKMNYLIISDLIGKKYNLFGLASAGLSFIVDLFANNTMGSIVAVFISFGIGVFSILKAREHWLELRNNRIRKDKLLDLKNQLEIEEIKKQMGGQVVAT